MPMRNVRLSADLARATENAAAREGVSVSEFVHRAITTRIEGAPDPVGDWQRYVGCGSSRAVADGEFARSVETKFARIERERHSQR